MIETYHRVDADHLEKTITIDDPKYYTRPCVPSETAKYNELFANPAAGGAR